MTLDQASRQLIGQLAGGTPTHLLQPEEVRAAGALLTEAMGPGPTLPQVRNLELTGADGGTFNIRVLAVAQPRAVIVYYHGGGWVAGDIDEFDTLGRKLAERTESAVLLVNYRKAPENPFPAAVEDGWAALRWADAQIEDIAGRRVPLIVAGDSAGANLATVVTMRARQGGPEIVLQILAYPVTDHDFDRPSYLDPDNQLLITRDSMMWFFDHYVEPHRREDPEVSPLHQKNLAGLPAAVVLIPEHDVLRDEGLAYAQALTNAGVAVNTRVFEGQLHGFFTLVNVLPGHETALNFIADAVAGVLDSASK